MGQIRVDVPWVTAVAARRCILWSGQRRDAVHRSLATDHDVWKRASTRYLDAVVKCREGPMNPAAATIHRDVLVHVSGHHRDTISQIPPVPHRRHLAVRQRAGRQCSQNEWLGARGTVDSVTVVQRARREQRRERQEHAYVHVACLRRSQRQSRAPPWGWCELLIREADSETAVAIQCHLRQEACCGRRLAFS